VVANYSRNKLFLVFATGVIFSFSGLMVAQVLLPLSALGALCVGMIVAGVLDLLLAYVTNYFFKVQQEREADLFAARYSTQEEIQAAALFFEKHQDLRDAHKDTNGFLNRLPSTLTTGHPDGHTRAFYLRSFIR
jgi:Zn-dependent protease with chaperone function